MSKSYTPGLKVLEKTCVKKERRLPLSGTVHVSVKQIVSPDEVVASTKIPGNVQMINVANELNVDPEQVSEMMLFKVDEKIKKGEVIARSKGLFGLFKSEVKSPIDGTIGNISSVTGQTIIAEPYLPIEVDAYIPGNILETFDKEGVVVESTGTLIQGIIGIGGEQKGCIQIINNDSLDKSQEDKIIIIKSNLTSTLYQNACKVGVKGIVCGGIDYTTLTEILKRPLGVAITGMEDTITVIVTEGFGDISMSERTFNLLSKNTGKSCSINGATQIRAGVMRPEIFIGSENKLNLEDVFDEDSLIISINSKVRIIREPYFGKIGKVIELPSQLVKIDTETTSRIAKIEFEDGTKEIIPRANLEVILSD